MMFVFCLHIVQEKQLHDIDYYVSLSVKIIIVLMSNE